MVLSDDVGEHDNVEEKFRSLCADLNIDRNTSEEAWRNYETISTNYTLEVIFCIFYSLPFYSFYTYRSSDVILGAFPHKHSLPLLLFACW